MDTLPALIEKGFVDPNVVSRPSANDEKVQRKVENHAPEHVGEIEFIKGQN